MSNQDLHLNPEYHNIIITSSYCIFIFPVIFLYFFTWAGWLNYVELIEHIYRALLPYPTNVVRKNIHKFAIYTYVNHLQ